MKEVKEERFKKKEGIEFNATRLPDAPTPKATEGERNQASERSNVRSNERTELHENLSDVLSDEQMYVISVPRHRRKTRQSFDIFEDQYDALKKLQLAEADQAESKSSPTLGEMMQQAIDAFIKERAKKLGNVRVVNE